MKAGQDNSGTAVAADKKGDFALAANTEASANVTGLAASTAYDIFVVAEDGSSNLTAVQKVDVTTPAAPDTTAPTFASGYPKTANVTHNALDLLVKANENGKAYYIVLADGATAPSAAQVKAGQDNSGTAVAADKKGDFALAANTEASANVTGLAASTAYDIFVVAEDGSSNLTAVQKVDVTTPAAPDTTAPTFASGYPKTANVTHNALDLLVKANENGKAYYIVLADGATAPSAAQVKAGQDSTSTAVAADKKGDFALTANTEATANLTGLAASTAYDMFVIAEDGSSNLTAVAKVDVTTTVAPDTTAPTFASGYPKTANVTHNALDLLVKANENGKAYYIVLADGATAPSAAQVKAGQDSTSTAVAADKKGDFALTANTEATANLTGLAASTAYDMFVIAEDGSSNLTAVAKVDVTTTVAPDTTAPTFASGYPKTANVTHNALDLLAKANENGKAHYIVLADGATAPSAAQVKAGQDSTGTAVAADKKGDFALAANTEATANLTGLAASTAYDIFVIAEDGGNNLTAVQKVDVTTPAAPSVPSTLPDLISYSFSAQETKTLPGTSTENNASSGSCNGTIKTEDQIGRLALVALFYQNFCYTDGRYNHNNYQVKRGTVIDSGNTLQFDAYQVYEPANKATEFLGSQHAVYYQFPTKEDYTVYRFEGNQFAKVLEITASQIDTTQFIQVANNGVILKVSQLTGSATYAFVPSNQRVSTFTELATGIEGARVKSTALGDVLKYRYTVNGTPFDTKLDFNQGPNTHSNVYSRTRQFFLVQKSTGQPGFVWQNKDDQSIQVTWLGSDFKSQTTVALPNSQSEDLAAAIHDASGSLYYLTIQSGSGADTETARTASLYKVNDNGQQLAKSTLDTSKTGLNMVKFGDQNIASLQYLNGKLGLIVGRQMHESSDGLNHQGAIAVVFDANSLNVDKNSMPLS